MKNIHVLPTDKPSRLGYIFDNLILNSKLLSPTLYKNQNIYITNDEEIKANVYALINGVLCKTEIKEGKIVSRQLSGGATMDICKTEYLEVILTDNTDLIKDGVQAIDDEFLQWFIQNQSCEKVEVIKNYLSNNGQWKDVLLPSEWEIDTKIKYKIIIPQKESKNTCPKCRTTDIETCHSIKCPMRKEEPTLDQFYEKALEMESEKQQKYDEMLAMLEELINLHELGHEIGQYDKARQLIKEAKEL
jgi:hypothetical protein